ncbi:MAG: XdhC/CoxI family protein [Acidobacteriota bacterium]
MSKEIQEILDGVAGLGSGERAVLATVVDLQGSGYRLPGARMLISPDGGQLGTVSGGCLEADVLERAKRVAASGKPEVFIYDTTADENSVFSLNMGCRGVIRILLESIEKDDVLVRVLNISQTERERQVVATLISKDSEFDVGIGCRLYYSEVEQFDDKGLPRFLVDSLELLEKCRAFYTSGRQYGLETIETPEGAFEFALENIEPPVSILLFGAGADAIPLARIAAGLGWRVTIFDHRPAFLTRERFPAASELVPLGGADEHVHFTSDPRTAAVIMTHNYGRDSVALPALLRSPVFYVGALGPKRRTELLIDELSSEGVEFTEAELARLYAPIGLDIGAQTPESIALSIIAEIQSVLGSRLGGHLRERKGSIYGR